MLAAATWPDVALALVAAIPATVAAIIGYLNHREIKTPNGGTLGALVDEAGRTAKANHAIIRRELGNRAGDHAPGVPDSPRTRVDDRPADLDAGCARE